jgi:hypothetical protein
LTSLDFPKIEKRKITEFLEPIVPQKYYYSDKSTAWDLLRNGVVKKNTVYQRRTYVRENKSSVSYTDSKRRNRGNNVPIIFDDN